jgi:hypothetical protein
MKIRLALLVFVLLLLLLWQVPVWEVPLRGVSPSTEGFASLVNDYRRTWAAVLGGLVILVGLLFTWQRLELAREEHRLAAEGQITERFTRAIDQLGSDELQIRLGGIYALERIARDSESDHWNVMEVLTAFVRVRAPRIPPEDADEHELDRYDYPRRGHRQPDIQAVLEVLGRRTTARDRGFLSLPSTDLSKADLSRANLTHADLTHANLYGADLSRAHLSYADLSRAHLSYADLNGADLKEAKGLDTADFKGVDLTLAFGVPDELLGKWPKPATEEPEA